METLWEQCPAVMLGVAQFPCRAAPYKVQRGSRRVSHAPGRYPLPAFSHQRTASRSNSVALPIVSFSLIRAQ
jgi:hypothetical protein